MTAPEANGPSADSDLYVTRPFLPPLGEFLPKLEQIWKSRELTNGAAFHREFETSLAEYLDVPYVSLFANATIALITALQCLRITGEVITTPYSFVATAHSLLWNGIEPVFADIDPVSLALDPGRVEAAITPRTTAIMPVHVYGRPADVDGLQRIADTYGLRLIYDAAHGFGARYRGQSLASFGDLAILSFHATKVFNTFEGGAIVCGDAQTKQRIDYLKNFGFADELTVVAAGINGKMNEFQAALGLAQLPYLDDCIAKRRQLAERYDRAFDHVDGLDRPFPVDGHVSNHSYYPIFIREAFRCSRDELYSEFKRARIHARRYFYPLISDFPMYRGRPSAAPAGLPNAHRAAGGVLCLPLYPELSVSDQQRVIDVVTRA